MLRDGRCRHVEQVPCDGKRADGHHPLDQRLQQLLRLRPSGLATELSVEELHGAQPGKQELLVLTDAGADEDADARAVPRPPLEARVLQRAADRVEQQAVLGICDLDAARGDAEMQRSERAQLFVLQVRAPGHIGLVGRPQRRVVEGLVVPARVGDRPEGDATRAHQVPERERIRRAGESTSETDDGDVHVGRPA